MQRNVVALWSLFVEVGDLRYSTQVTADEPRSAVDELLRSHGFRDKLAGMSKDGWPSSFTSDDVVLLMPMDGLVNMHLCQLGREGKYVSVVMARTESKQHV